ncbi:type II toxin-antitoxin system RelE/ParE family toxin [Collimonas fungivorans]|uniref:type II toxin-antitoxin system RelE/ParE family toxin n=1 Tax=Collimonas fungivorans TaxID=158899 RepID=UPI0034E934B2
MLEISLSDIFKDWLRDLHDAQGKAKILTRIRSASYGNLGDVEPVGEGVSELRIHCGPGYRIYFTRRGKALIDITAGGWRQVLAKERHQACQTNGEIVEGIKHETNILRVRRCRVSGQR